MASAGKIPESMKKAFARQWVDDKKVKQGQEAERIKIADRNEATRQAMAKEYRERRSLRLAKTLLKEDK